MWRERVRRLDLPIPSVPELKKQAKNGQKEGQNDVSFVFSCKSRRNQARSGPFYRYMIRTPDRGRILKFLYEVGTDGIFQ